MEDYNHSASIKVTNVIPSEALFILENCMIFTVGLLSLQLHQSPPPPFLGFLRGLPALFYQGVLYFRCDALLTPMILGWIIGGF
jgi:hypothetical protein